MKRIWIVIFSGWVLSSIGAQPPYQKVYESGDITGQALRATPLMDGGVGFIGVQDGQLAVTRLGCEGEVVWSKLLGASSTINNTYPAVESDAAGRIWFAGNIGVFQNYDALIGVFSADGELLRAVRLGLPGRDDHLFGLKLADDGTLYVAGGTNSWGSDRAGSPSFTDVFVARLDTNLNMVWARTLGNPQAIERAYDLALDTNGHPVVTGRYIVNGTFCSFLLQMDGDGNVSNFKAYGETTVPHSAIGWGVTATADGGFLIAGGTTIQKTNFQSAGDAFLIRTDAEGNPVFRHIYIPTIGNDNSDSGSSVVELPDGRIALGVSTMSFTHLTQGFVPNKNAVFVLTADGEINVAHIYNRGGSHFTKVRGWAGGLLISAFSNFYGAGNPGAGAFKPLIMLTDETFRTGCHELEVTNALTQVAEPGWETFDVSYQVDTAWQLLPYTTVTPYNFEHIRTECESPELLMATLNIPESVCVGEFVELSADTTGNILRFQWGVDDQTIFSNVLDTTYAFEKAGTFTITFEMAGACEVVAVHSEIHVVELVAVDSFRICPGDTVYIGEEILTDAGDYEFSLPGTPCDTVLLVHVEVINCACDIELPNLFTPNGDQLNDDFGAVINCELEVRDYALQVFNRWGALIFETRDPGSRWDGQYRGQPAPMDTYAWRLVARYAIDGEEFQTQRRGDIMLIR